MRKTLLLLNSNARKRVRLIEALLHSGVNNPDYISEETARGSVCVCD